MFQSPDGDSVVSHAGECTFRQMLHIWRFQSPDGDSVVSHQLGLWTLGCSRSRSFSPLTGIPWFPTRPTDRRRPTDRASRFQSPDGDSVVSHSVIPNWGYGPWGCVSVP